jgi:hypothetical protein
MKIGIVIPFDESDSEYQLIQKQNPHNLSMDYPTKQFYDAYMVFDKLRQAYIEKQVDNTISKLGLSIICISGIYVDNNGDIRADLITQ